MGGYRSPLGSFGSMSEDNLNLITPVPADIIKAMNYPFADCPLIGNPREDHLERNESKNDSYGGEV